MTTRAWPIERISQPGPAGAGLAVERKRHCEQADSLLMRQQLAAHPLWVMRSPRTFDSADNIVDRRNSSLVAIESFPHHRAHAEISARRGRATTLVVLQEF